MSRREGAVKHYLKRGKVPTGIQGLDEITDKGLPKCRTALVTGGRRAK